MWNDCVCNTRGRVIERVISLHSISILNDESPTHIDPRTRTETVIDLSLCSTSITLDFNFQVDYDLHHSDHFPIILTMQVTSVAERPMKWHFSNVNWSTFAIMAECSRNPEDFNQIDDMVEYFTTTIFNAANNCIKRSCGRINKKSVPWWNNDCKEALRHKRRAWNKYRRNKSEENFIAFKKANAIARRVMRTSKKDCWKKYVSSINENTPMTSVWRKVHKISGKYVTNPTPVLSIGGNIIANPEEVAEKLADHFSNISKGKHLSNEFHSIKIRQEQQPINFYTDIHEDYNDPFTLKELVSSLSKCKSTAEGPDDIHYEMLKHLSMESKKFLLKLYNRIWLECEFPSWKIATILPFKKPGKSGENPSDYRPIALTSCVCKLFERMVNVRLQWYLETKTCLSPFQYGYRRGRSTTDALVSLEMYIRNAFAKQESVTSVFFYLEKAYDTTWRYNILRELHNIGLRGNLPLCIKNFFQSRAFKVRVNNNYSSTHQQHEGVPQGSVLSTTCFIIAINSISHVLPCGVRYSIYVDDLLVSYAGSNKAVVQNVLQTAINNITKWTTEHGFKFSVNKTVAVTFSRQKRITRPTLSLYNVPIQFADKVKFLGVVFDSRLTFKAHISELKIKCMKSLNLLRVLSYTTWGADRNT